MQRASHFSFGRWLAAFALAFFTAAAAQGLHFDIERYVVEGNTLLPEKRVQAIVAPFTGKNRTLADVRLAARGLQDEYQRRGYVAVLVTVPGQEVRDGQVRLRVSEARVAHVRVQGNRFFGEDNVRRSVPALKEGALPNTRELAEAAQLANDNPAKHIGISLRAEDLRNVEATIGVADERPWSFSVFADNTGTPSTGYNRAGIGYRHANLFNRDHVLTAQLITSPDKANDVVIAGLGYRMPIYSWRGAFDAVLGYSNVSSGTLQNLFTVSGSGTLFGLHYTQYLRRFGTYEQKLQGGWDRREFRNNVSFLGSESLLPDVTVQPASVAYLGRIRTLTKDLGFYLSAARNIPGGGDASQDAVAATRPGADALYSVFRAGAVYSWTLPRSYVLRALFNAQYTHDLLVPGEQFGVGGVSSVRGFFEREAINDVGLQISAEGYTPDFGRRIGDRWSARALVFVDAAGGRDHEPKRGPDNTLSSVGLGLQLARGKAFAVRFDWAYVTQGAGTRPTGSNRLHFAAACSFP